MIDPEVVHASESMVVLSSEDREALALLMTEVRFRSGERVLMQDRRAPAAYMLIEGSLHVEHRVGAHALTGRIEPGEWFGVASLCDGKEVTASVYALTDLSLAALGRGDFEDLIRSSNGLGARLLRAWLRSLSFQLARVNDTLVALRQHRQVR